MKPYDESEEPAKPAASTAGSDTGNTASDERIIARFRQIEFDPQGRIKNRIRLNLAGQDNKTGVKHLFGYKAAAGVLVSCLIIFALVYRQDSHDSHQPDIRPDYYAYYNFPSTGDEAMLLLNETPPDWLDYHRFPGIQFTGKI
ncbi:MAG: hypothetical protein A2270_10290 [Elusimicrobia bacterium RIFOXYA12_FULL_51_18]|nr:MAG: hypothetical protein A2270_10290 [Elusimicrobia bacterium RIFOXYA12_FULL_51_18]OGS29546.1 MAG: hypothetical protein A2218_00900 [Elusimicrobia bacterium RIFOXYA2_FULL_53_38]